MDNEKDMDDQVNDQVVTPATTDEDEVEAGDQPEVAPVAEGETEAGEPAMEEEVSAEASDETAA